MLGWMILFGLMTLIGAIMTLTTPASVSALMSLMFGLLFFLGLVTRLVRGRSW
jgi:hypothetical protein